MEFSTEAWRTEECNIIAGHTARVSFRWEEYTQLLGAKRFFHTGVFDLIYSVNSRSDLWKGP